MTAAAPGAPPSPAPPGAPPAVPPSGGGGGLDPRVLTVVVTGASSGFGAAAASRFARAGSRVVAAARRAGRVETLAESLGEAGARVLPLALDVRDRAAVDAAFSSLPEGFASPNVLVNNAGLALGLTPVEATDPALWDDMIETNIRGLLNCTRAVLPGMIERGEGHVISISSVAATYPYPGGNVYGGTKAFVSQFSIGLKADLAGRPVRVTCIEPGKANTEFSLVRFGGDRARADAAYEGYEPLDGADVAECIFWAATLPRRININRLEVMPLAQGFADFPLAKGMPPQGGVEG